MTHLNKTNPLILITNDDGIESPGLWALVEALEGLGDLLVVAPRYQQTGMGRSFPRGDRTGVIETLTKTIGKTVFTAYGVHGSPAQAVSHAVMEIAARKPDLCVSGINYGENLGLSLTCSGTLGAAFEADSHFIPAIAFSRAVDLSKQHLENFDELEWTNHKAISRKVVQAILRKGFPVNVSIMNVNIPEGANLNTEFRTTTQCRQNYSVFKKPAKRDFNKRFMLESEIDIDIHSTDRNSDIYAFFFDKVISITPLTWRFSVDIDWNVDDESC